MSVILFLLYTIAFGCLLHYLATQKKIRISSSAAISGFLIKVLLGCLYGYIFSKKYGGDDTWHYHELSLIETQELMQHPIHFLRNCFSAQHYIQNFVMTKPWESIQYGSFIKMLSFFNVLSGGHYYVNVVFFNMITFWGAYLFYQFFSQLFKHQNRLLWFIIFAFIPLIFWTSGVRKDGMIFLGIALLLYYFNRYLQTIKSKYLIGALIGFGLLILNRNVLALTFIPGCIGWYWSMHKNKNPFLTQVIIASSLFIALFLLPNFLIDTLVRKHQEFDQLTGGSRVHLPTVNSSLQSLLAALPQALSNVLFKPIPLSISNPLIFFSGLETLFTLIVLVLAIFFLRKDLPTPTKAAIGGLLSICLVNYIVIGLIVPFLGATIRYRVVFEFILIAIGLLSIDWVRLKRYILN